MATDSFKPLKCIYSRNGCEQQFRTDNERKQHHRRCIYQEDECPQCENLIQRKNLGKHAEEECTHRPIHCEYCGEECFFKDINVHKDVCSLRPVECDYCKENFKQSQLAYHKERICYKRPSVFEAQNTSHVNKFEKDNERVRDFTAYIPLIFENLRQLRDHFIQLKEENCKLRSEIAEIKRENLNIREDYKKISKVCDELNKDIPKLAQGMTCLTTEVKNLIDRNKEREDSTKYHTLAIKSIQEALNQERQTLSESLKKQRSFAVEVLSRLDKMEDRVEKEGEVDSIYLCVGCEVYVEAKSLAEIRCAMVRQLYSSESGARDKLTMIVPGIDMDEVAVDKDLGNRHINGEDYRCEITQWKYAGGDRGMYLSIRPVSSEQPWPPIHVDRAMWCLLDSASTIVYYYRVLEGWLDTSATTGFKYKVFGWFDIGEDKYQRLKDKSQRKKLQSAFVIFKQPK